MTTEISITDSAVDAAILAFEDAAVYSFEPVRLEELLNPKMAFRAALTAALPHVLAAQQEGADFNMVIFAIEDAVRNGVCPWGIESAFDAYELERRVLASPGAQEG